MSKVLYLPAAVCVLISIVVLCLEYVVWDRPYPNTHAIWEVFVFFLCLAGLLAYLAWRVQDLELLGLARDRDRGY